MKLRRWYFAINDAGIPHFDRCIRVALKSAKANTRLEPICIYSGNGAPFIDEIRRMGATVIRHKSSLADAIANTENANGWHKNIATGANLRLDIPIIEKKDPFVLYTDCDVMFLKHPKVDEAPEYFAAAPEHDKTNWSFANTGVMVINVENMRRDHSALIDFAAPRLNTFGPLGKGTYDQGILNAYYARRWSRLPLEMNWKPYWGINPNASIIHYHGPKPQFVEAIHEGRDVPPVYRSLHARDPNAYRTLLDQFLAIEQSSPPRWSWRRIFQRA
jgi:lipopolysaccharide biosynthesis glycosyltransferase